MPTRIPIAREAVADFCRRHHVRKLALFGSVLRDDFRPEGDVDVLVGFERRGPGGGRDSP
ncbi:MAG TPA: nucleotidyltransferase domain-containing protein [Geminicoccaceae bacterium]|nr:nucleotidyltransferase domain-containing protein [Geminicoccaceae bacterium]